MLEGDRHPQQLPSTHCRVRTRAQISKTYTHYGATALFFFFGVRMLYEAFTGAASAAGESELEEVEKELQVRMSQWPALAFEVRGTALPRLRLPRQGPAWHM